MNKPLVTHLFVNDQIKIGMTALLTELPSIQNVDPPFHLKLAHCQRDILGDGQLPSIVTLTTA